MTRGSRRFRRNESPRKIPRRRPESFPTLARRETGVKLAGEVDRQVVALAGWGGFDCDEIAQRVRPEIGKVSPGRFREYVSALHRQAGLIHEGISTRLAAIARFIGAAVPFFVREPDRRADFLSTMQRSRAADDFSLVVSLVPCLFGLGNARANAAGLLLAYRILSIDATAGVLDIAAVEIPIRTLRHQARAMRPKLRTPLNAATGEPSAVLGAWISDAFTVDQKSQIFARAGEIINRQLDSKTNPSAASAKGAAA